jgi:tripartite-type tricarboxylate transporter receptor subunit TctC
LRDNRAFATDFIMRARPPSPPPSRRIDHSPRITLTAALVLAGLSALALPCPIAAQPYPARPIQIYVSFPPGSGIDFTARVVAEKLRERLGQPVLVENRLGAGAVLGAAHIARAVPDGYSIAVAGTTELAVAVSTRRNLGYDPRRDFAPLAMLVDVPQWIVAGAQIEARTLAELVSAARRQPGRLTFASYGQGTLSHLGQELFKAAAAIDLLHVPYRIGPQAHADLIGGRVTVLWDSVAAALPHVRAAKLKALAVTTAARLPYFANTPTVAETGYPGFEVSGWAAAVAPAATPADIAQRLGSELRAIMSLPEIRARLMAAGLDAHGASADATRERIHAYIEKFAEAVRISGFQPD